MERRAISIQQPWAWAIIFAGKDIENRTWPSKYRGTLYIHTGKKFDMEGWQFLRSMKPQLNIPYPNNFNQGGVIGRVQMVDCVTASPSEWFAGPYGFALRDPERLLFEPLKGRLGIFKI